VTGSSHFGWRAVLSRAAIAGTLLPLPLILPAEAGALTKTPSLPIKHLIVVMQDNHSFDNYFGTYPDADGIPSSACVPVDPHDPETACIDPFHVAGASVARLDDSALTHSLQYHGGRLDGFVDAFRARNRGGPQAMGHYDRRDLPLYWDIADSYVLFDRFFASGDGASFENRMFWIAGVPGGSFSERRGFTFSTIFDRLHRAGISWKFYVEDYDPALTFHTPLKELREDPQGRQVAAVPLLNFARFVNDGRLGGGIVDLEQFYIDLQNERLPAVSYVAPIASSEKPPASPDAGQRFLRGLLNALMGSPAWRDSVFLATYDSWGGWYDHVAPPRVDPDGYGFRVPALLVSPYARAGYIDHTTLDYTSILRFIENSYGLERLGARDAQAASIGEALDFSRSPRRARLLPSAVEPLQGSARASPRVLYGAYAAGLLLSVLLIARAVALGSRRKLRESNVVSLVRRRAR